MTKTPETYQEALDRVFLLGAGSGGTWDLSDADVAALAMVLKRLDELERDAKRLDWLECHPFMAYRQRDPEDGVLYDHFTLVDEDKPTRSGIVKPSLREAIDAAIQSGQLRRAPTEECGVVYTDDKPLRED